MMKKIISTLLITVCAAVALWADNADWRHYMPFAGTEQMAETRGRVYFTSAGALFAYDKKSDETLVFNAMNALNDNNDVTGVYAPANGSFVVVAYSNGNMDLLRDDGTVANLPDIKDSRQGDKGINHVAFSDDLRTMLVATVFGLVRYDLSRLEVIDSGIFYENIKQAAFIDGHPAILIYGALRTPPVDSSLRDLDSWSWLATDVQKVVNSGGNLYALMTIDGQERPALLTLDASGKHLEVNLIGNASAGNIVAGSQTEPLAVASNSTLSMVDAQGNITNAYSVPDDFNTAVFTAAGGPANLWTGSKTGVSNADITAPYVYDPIKPGELSVKSIYLMTVSADGQLLMSDRGNSNVFGLSGGNIGHQSVMNPDGTFTDTQPHGLEIPASSSRPSPEGYLFDPLFITPSPIIKGIYYTGNLSAGVYAINASNGTQVAHFTPENSPINGYWCVRDVAFDSNGYMWLFSENDMKNPPSLMALSPAGQLKLNDVKIEDWVVAEAAKDFYSARDGQILVSHDGRLLYLKADSKIGIYDTKGTPSLADDTFSEMTRFRMADGSGYPELQRFNRILEDPRDGSIWVSTDDGVFTIPLPKPEQGIVDIVKPKVARNDGTGLADYLLSSQKVVGLAIDGARHKWFTTYDSGVFMTSPDGTQILQNYNTSNSPLPSNMVLTVATHPQWADKVYFGTRNGLMEYRSGYSAPAADLKDVLIYPNPVKPDYTGAITIRGLMDASRVKILSPGGNLVAELTSDGGMVRWSGNGTDGRRVPAGVYHVLASTPDNGARQVGKIVVIR